MVAFEPWLYANENLETALGAELYLDLIACRFSSESEVDNLRRRLRPILDRGASCECFAVRDLDVIDMGEDGFTDLCHLVMHLAENPGSHFAQNKGERELRAKRMRAIEEKAQAMLETLGMHLEAEHKGRDEMIAQLAGRVEEERLSLIASRQRESRVLDQGQER